MTLSCTEKFLHFYSSKKDSDSDLSMLIFVLIVALSQNTDIIPLNFFIVPHDGARRGEAD